MADLQHSALPDNQLHYPRGSAGASANTWLMANGDGTTAFNSLPTTALKVVDRLTSVSSVAQELTVLGEEAQITLGPAETSPGGCISVDSTGAITILQDGVYDLTFRRNTARTTNAAINTIALAIRADGVQAAPTSVVSLDNADAGVSLAVATTGIAELPAGTVLTLHMLYETGASGNIGLYPKTIADAAWEDVPSAHLTVSKLGVV